MPTLIPIILVLFACLALAAGLINSLMRPAHRLLTKASIYWGMLMALVALIWHSIVQHQWMPLDDNFESLLWIGLLIAGFVLYVQRTRPLMGLDWFLLPIVILLLASATLFGRIAPHFYSSDAWDWFHRTSSYLGAAAFAVACAGGAMYLIANHRLRSKTALPNPYMASLERLEHLTFASVTLGFALLTIGLITGFMIAVHDGGSSQLGPHWLLSPKVLLSGAVWIVYALVLHSPINPRFRGRRAAMLSILGFVLMLGTLIAVQFMPEVRR
ncbi:MAG TPA: cytochrome c biogenesis protein CcsA [Tepidisphaeraceae bacterium]|nr:cytochrome c biogenesis protein CcsA [Tepidisphaeraceae bacterium]